MLGFAKPNPLTTAECLFHHARDIVLYEEPHSSLPGNTFELHKFYQNFALNLK